MMKMTRLSILTRSVLLATFVLAAVGSPAWAADSVLTLIGAGGANDAPRHEWVFVDTPVAGYQGLVDDLLSGGDDGRHIELVLLDSRRDGLEQIAEALAGRSGTDAIHLITHGSQAELQLGTARLTTDSMLGAYADRLSGIGQALTEGGDILRLWLRFRTR